VKAIQALRPPSNIKELRKMLGMVNYLKKNLPHVQATLQPLNLLLSGKRAWRWGPEQEDALIKLKHILTSTPVLSYFDPKYGVGGVLLQKT